MTALLDISKLGVAFHSRGRSLHAVIEASLKVERGQRVGIIGESGSGKSVMARAVMRLDNPRTTRMSPGTAITFDGQDILGLGARELHALRGNQISMVFQNPMHSLNPSFTIGSQMATVFETHNRSSKHDTRARVVDALGEVDLPDPATLVDRYPHELSGGQRQRVMVAMAVLCNPKLIIADEPTSALDVTAQETVLDVLERLSRERDIAIMLITHDMGVVARFCETVAVMYGGRIVETGSVGQVFANPSHPYTAALLAATPDPTRADQELKAIPGSQANRLGDVIASCAFKDRCPFAAPECSKAPDFAEVAPDHTVACHFAGQLDLGERG